jgi:hypothetical protein
MKRLPLSIAALAWLACFLGQRSYAQLQASWIQPAPQPQVVSSCMAVDGAGRSVHGGWKVGLDGSSAATLTLYDALGNLLWARVFAAQLSERIYALGFDSTGNIVAAGRRAGFVGTTFISDVVLWKLDLAGNVLWSTMYDDGANGSENASKLALTPTDEIVVLGFAGPLTPGEDVGVWKFAANGSLIWARRVDGSQHLDDAGSQLALASDGSIYATALVNSVLGVSSDAAVLKLDANGTLLWQREFGPSGATLDLPGGDRAGCARRRLRFGDAVRGLRPQRRALASRRERKRRLDASKCRPHGRGWRDHHRPSRAHRGDVVSPRSNQRSHAQDREL